MTAPDVRALADAAAVKLTALAAALEATAGIDLSAAPEHELGTAVAGVSESRREAAGALERLGEALPDAHGPYPRPRNIAPSQWLTLRSTEPIEAENVRSWASAWRAFADAT